MKRLTILLLTLLAGTSLLRAQGLQALFSYKTFYSPQNGPYVETYLSVNAATVDYSLNKNGKYQGAIEISYTFTDAGGAVKHSDRYNLLSPEVSDTADIRFNFIDQQRVQLPNGTYSVELTIADRKKPEKPYKVNETVKLEYYDNIVKVSDIQLVDSYSKSTTPSLLTKSGLDLVPYVDNFYPTHLKSLKFYAEIYNTDDLFGESACLVTYYVESAESRQMLENLRGFSKEAAQQVIVLLREVPLTELPSGNYNLVIEVRNQRNELVTQNSVFFQRSNIISLPASADFRQVDVENTFAAFITNKDTLADYINSLHPIASPVERTFLTNQIKLADVKMMQQFFYDFWQKRSPVNPEKAWLDYNMEVQKVNREFGTRIRKGYATDRGRVYLQYGPPNTISKNYTEPSAYPYEIWHYYKLANQSNRKFVFYNSDLVTNDFDLLHSDALGEPYNNQWQLIIHQRDTQSRDYDKESKGDDYFGNKAKDNFDIPK